MKTLYLKHNFYNCICHVINAMLIGTGPFVLGSPLKTPARVTQTFIEKYAFLHISEEKNKD